MILNRIQEIFHLIRPKADSCYQANGTICWALQSYASLCRRGREAGEREKESARETMEGGREKLRKRGSCPFSLPIVHRLLAIFIGIPSGSVSTEETVILSIPMAKIATVLYQSPGLSNRNPVVAVENVSINSWRHLRRHRMVGGRWQMNSSLLSEDYTHVYEVSSLTGC